MKSILIISRYFYPELSPRAHRTTELARELDRIGHRVELGLPDSDFDYREVLAGTKINLLFYGKVKSGSFHFGKGRLPDLLSRIWFRLLNIATDYPNGVLYFRMKKFLRGRGPYDLIISIAQPHPIHWGVAAAKRKNPGLCKRWVADCGDPFSGTVTDSFKKPFYLRILENRSFDMADFITIPIEGAKPAYHSRFHDRIRIIPQAFEFKTYPTITLDTDKVHPCFAYAGIFIPGFRDPRKFLDYLVHLDLDFRFYIFTKDDSLIRSYVDKSKGRIIVKDFIPRDELISKLKSVDFLINIDNNTEIHSPSKLIDYTQAERPVLNIQDQLDQDAIDAFLQGNYSKRMRLPDIEKYNIRNVAKQFMDLLDGE
jgi:hypothetical protein